MNHIQVHQALIRKQLSASYVAVSDIIIGSTDDIIIKGEEDELNKAKVTAQLGTIKKFGGRDYIKTTSGWKYHGKGGGEKAQDHKATAAGGGMKVGEGSHITTKEGAHGVVSKVDETHTHIEHTDMEGKKKISKVKNEDMASKIASGDFAHSVPASAAAEAANAAGKETKITPEKLAEAKKDALGDPKERFEAFELYTQAVIQGKSKSMIAYGTGGVGKTYTVTKQLEEAGKKPFDEDRNMPGDDKYDYVKITGKATPVAVYQALYEHNGKTIIFDDCDSVLKDTTAINLFKGALDTSGDGTIAYGSSKKIKGEDGEELPQRFKFTGRVIFISNLSSDEMPQPLKSRALKIDLTMDKKQTVDRIKEIATNKEGKLQNLKFPGLDNYSDKEMSDVIAYLDKHKEEMGDLNVRTVGKVLAIRQMAKQAGKEDRWEKFADNEIFSKSESMNNTYDGSEIHKARAANIAKSYGIDLSKTSNIEKSEDVTSKDHVAKAMGTDNTPGFETVEGKNGKAIKNGPESAIQKSLTDAFGALESKDGNA